jgi:hypothetical protein
VAVSAAQGATVWGAASNGNLYTVDPFSGATTLVGAMGVVMFDIAYSPTFGLMGISGGPISSLYSINPLTGAATLIGTTGVFVNAATFSPDGLTLYAAGGPAVRSLYSINVASGAATLIGTDVGANLYTSAGDLAFASNGNLYVTSTGAAGGNNFLYLINPANGDGTRIGAGTGIGFPQVYGLVAIGNTMFGFTASTQQVITIDVATGKGAKGPNYGGGQFYGTATDAPEPPTLPLLSLGLAALAAWSMRPRRATPPS